jgi:2-keto-4-pentenoate hydratase/2-oxohepta-3-ene-1,7-dioic acid hydratase in catechol pathway
VDWEAELAIVIGTPAWQLSGPDAALDHIAGYTVANDLSERQWQLEISGGQWSKGKGAPGFCPLGPWLVTDADPSDLSVQSFVNGDVRQDSRTSDMIFDVATIVARLSAHTLLEPGDVILTGTPEGVALSGRFPYLTDDDVVEIAIEGLGRQRQRVAAAV